MNEKKEGKQPCGKEERKGKHKEREEKNRDWSVGKN